MFPSPLSARIALICLTCTLSWSSLSRADEYLGAEAVLKQSEDPANLIASAKNPLREAMAAYKPEKLSVEQAANDWLDLFDKQRLQRHSYRQADPVQAEEIFWLLPPPSSWEALKAAIQKRPIGNNIDGAMNEISLKVMAELLTDNPKGAVQEMRKGEESLQHEIRRYGGDSPFSYMEQEIIESSNDPALLMAFLEREIAAKRGRDRGSLILRDPVTRFGEEKAAALIKMALTQTEQPLSISGKESRALAEKIAIQNIDSLKSAPWSLVNSIEGAALFEALSKRFSKDPERKGAEGYYLLSLIADEKPDQANQFLSSLKSPSKNLIPDDGIRDLKHLGKSGDLFDFLDKAVDKNPNLPVWDAYIATAIQIGEADQAVKKIKQALSGKKLTAENRRAIEKELPEVLLKLNQVEEGIAALQKVIADTPLASPAGREDDLTARAEAAQGLTQLGLLLQRPALVNEGIAALQATLKAATDGGIRIYEGRALPGLLYQAGRGVEAEKVLGDALKRKDDSPSTLLDLCTLYSLTGRDADVITLLQEASGWGYEDLLPFLTHSSSNFTKARVDLPLGYIAAKALAVTGKPKEAEAILQQLIKEKPGFDPAYELLLKLKGPAFTKELDQMIALDRFQERPQIWKAQLLLNQGNFEEAEKTVKQAIEIDPSDGEEGPDDRMRAYAVLAKIRAAKGDKKGAELYENVMKAIRLSEDADRYASAGLLTRASAMYQEALTYFADAYCVQSRLAKNLWELGRYQEAEAHYQRAYELMPDSFGRVESHCFGCEGAFTGQKQQTIAEQIFRKFVKESPTKPQVHYLLGYLLEAQDKKSEALASYREAVKLDPDYLNAWKKIADMETKVSPEERQTAILQILRLDPLGRHGSRSELRKIRSPKKLWEAVASVSSKTRSRQKASIR